MCSCLLSFALGLHGTTRDSVTLLFTGDVLLGRDVGRVARSHGGDWLFSPSIDSLFADADGVIANLECPSTVKGYPVNKQFVFNSDPKLLTVLRHHGITHLNLANNHSVDRGREGLVDTYYNIKSHGMVPIGYGDSAAMAAKPLRLCAADLRHSHDSMPRPVYIVSSLRLVLENYSYLPDRPSVCQSSVDVLCDTVKAVKQRDPKACVIVCLHWGAEHTLHPMPDQRQDARRLVDAGADAIVGHHTHTAQDVEIYRGKPIFYSLGNFIFDLDRPLNRHGMVAKLVITKDDIKVHTVNTVTDKCRVRVLDTPIRQVQAKY